MRLLKIEWLKLKKYRTFYILSGLFLSIFLLINGAVSGGAFSFSQGGNGAASVNLISSDYSFPKVWDNMAYYLGWCIIFICVFIIINITNDYRYKTQRQHIIDGQGRIDYLHSKVALVLGINIALTLVYIISCLIFGYANGGGNLFKGTENILYVFLYGMNYIAFSALIALVIKRSGLSIVLLFAFVFFEEIIIALIKSITNLKLSNYFPLDSSDGFFPKPLEGMAEMATQQLFDKPNYTIMVIMSCVWIGVYYFLARWRMQKADL